MGAGWIGLLVGWAMARPLTDLCVEEASLPPLPSALEPRRLIEPRELDAFRRARARLQDDRAPEAADLDPAAFLARLSPGSVGPSDQLRVEAFAAPHPIVPGRQLTVLAWAAPSPPPEAWQAAHLVLLVDTSPSMGSVVSRRYPSLPGQESQGGLYPPTTRLDVARGGLSLLAGQFPVPGQVALARYGGSSGVLLSPTDVERPQPLREAVERLKLAGGLDRPGLDQALRLGSTMYQPCTTNKVVVLTDYEARLSGDYQDTLAELREAGEAIQLSAISIGMGDRAGGALEQVAAVGRGRVWYVETAWEASLALASELRSPSAVYTDVAVAAEEPLPPHRVVGPFGGLGALARGWTGLTLVESVGPLPPLTVAARRVVDGEVEQGVVPVQAVARFRDADPRLRLAWAATALPRVLALDPSEPATEAQVLAEVSLAQRPGEPGDAELRALAEAALRRASREGHHRP